MSFTRSSRPQTREKETYRVRPVTYLVIAGGSGMIVYSFILFFAILPTRPLQATPIMLVATIMNIFGTVVSIIGIETIRNSRSNF